jgi:hypothetical protein
MCMPGNGRPGKHATHKTLQKNAENASVKPEQSSEIFLFSCYKQAGCAQCGHLPNPPR